MPVELLRELGAIPSYYLRYFYEHDRVLAEQREGLPRAERVAEIERELLELYRDPALDSQAGAARAARRRLLQRSGDGPRRRPVTPTAASVQVVDGRNGERSPGWRPTTWSRSRRGSVARGRVPIAQEPLAPELLGLVQHVAAYERLTAEAAVSRDPRVARLALLAHPLVGQWDLSGELLDRLAAAEASGVPLRSSRG